MSRYFIHSNLYIELQQPPGNLCQFVCHRNLPHGIILAEHTIIPMLFSCRLSQSTNANRTQFGIRGKYILAFDGEN